MEISRRIFILKNNRETVVGISINSKKGNIAAAILPSAANMKRKHLDFRRRIAVKIPDKGNRIAEIKAEKRKIFFRESLIQKTKNKKATKQRKVVQPQSGIEV